MIRHQFEVRKTNGRLIANGERTDDDIITAQTYVNGLAQWATGSKWVPIGEAGLLFIKADSYHYGVIDIYPAEEATEEVLNRPPSLGLI